MTSHALMTGKTMHWRRSAEAEHRFTYPVMYVRLNMTALFDHVGTRPFATRLFQHNKWSLYSFFDADHGEKQAKTSETAKSSRLQSSARHTSLLTWFTTQLHHADISQDMIDNISRVELITQPRVLGYVFNPVSFWMAYDAKNQLRLVLAEVNNTFGVRLSYLLTLDSEANILAQHSLTTSKRLHVSPFFNVTGSYRFQFDVSETHTRIKINYFRTHSAGDDVSQHTPTLVTTLDVTAKPVTQKNVLKTFGQYGLSTLAVITRIHWQALKLKIKGARFHKSPPEPRQEMHHESTRTQ